MEIQRQNHSIAPKTSTTSLIGWFLENDITAIAEFSTTVTLKAAKEGTPLAVLKASNPSEAYKAVGSAIRWLQLALNIKSPMNDFQIADASITIVNTYYWLRFEEIVMILGMIKTGKTGGLYQSFDVQSLCLIIEDYLKSEELAIYHEKEASNYKKQENVKIEMSEESRKKFEEIYESIKIIEPVKEEKEPVDENGKPILIRHADYYNQLKTLLPDMSETEISELRKKYVGMNYIDGIQLIDKFRNKE